MNTDSRLIVALDNLSFKESFELVFELKEFIWGVKFNDQLYDMRLDDLELLSRFTNIMCDPKLFDIPNTISNSISKLINAGVKIVTVHALAEYERQEYRRNVAGITVLTSTSAPWINKWFDTYREKLVYDLALSIVARNWGQVVCSAQDLAVLSDNRFSNLKKICPGIRLSSEIKDDDQRNIATPGEAIRKGADYLVVGRPITLSVDPVSVVTEINLEIYDALKKRGENV